MTGTTDLDALERDLLARLDAANDEASSEALRVEALGATEVNVRVAMVIAALCVSAAWPAHATTPYQREVTCPVGGERFSFTDTMSSSSFGQRPDGKPYSNWDYPLPVCPGNGLVVYREFTADEIARLPAIIGSAQFADISALGQPYYTASFIERSLLPASLSATWLLLQASWRVDDNPTLKAQFQREFVEAAQRTELDPGNEESSVMHLRLANALRELSRFDEAEAEFSALSSASFDGADSFKAYVQMLQQANARRDASSEPLDVIPTIAAASLCLAHEGEAGWDAEGFCRGSELSPEVERIHGNRRRAGIGP